MLFEGHRGSGRTRSVHASHEPQVGAFLDLDESEVQWEDARDDTHGDRGTVRLAVATLHHWWTQLGQRSYPSATRMLIALRRETGAGSVLWKPELQQFTHDTGVDVLLCQIPPGTSRWSKIEHRASAHVTHQGRGNPPARYEAVVDVVAH